MINTYSNSGGGGNSITTPNINIRRRNMINERVEPLYLFENGKYNPILKGMKAGPYCWHAASRGDINTTNNMIEIWHNSYVGYGLHSIYKIDYSVYKKLYVEFDLPYTGPGCIFVNFVNEIINCSSNNANAGIRTSFPDDKTYSITTIKSTDKLQNNIFTANIPDRTGYTCYGDTSAYFCIGMYYNSDSNGINHKTRIKRIWLE